MYYERTLKQTLQSISETFPILMLTGPRQVGKTTLLTKMAESSRAYVSLDDPSARLLASQDPGLFLQRYAPPVLIDEVQYAPQLFDHIKIHADRHKRPGDFWLTGSQTFHVMKKATESLAGRVGIVHMLGLSNSEISGCHFPPFTIDPQQWIDRLGKVAPMSLQQVFQRIFTGSMPRLYENESVNREAYFESYLETYISRDVKDLTQVADELAFLNFVNIVAARTASNVNYETLANEAGISAPTAKQWLSVLVTSGLVVLIQPYSNNALKRVVKSPRMYFLDTGLCAHLTRWDASQTLEYGAMSGQFFETWVVSEIYKSYLNNGKRPPLFYYRDSNKKEIDLLIHQNNTVFPIEIKKASSPKDAVRHFSVLKPIEAEPSEQALHDGTAHLKTMVGPGAVVCLAHDVLPIDHKNWYVPAWLI